MAVSLAAPAALTAPGSIGGPADNSMTESQDLHNVSLKCCVVQCCTNRNASSDKNIKKRIIIK